MTNIAWELLRGGDLIRLYLSGDDNFYVGYVWYTSKTEFENAGEGKGEGTYFGIRRADIFLSPISPNGIDKTVNGKYDDSCLEYKIQMTGIDIKNNTFCGVPVIAYDFIALANRK